jgi:hypothetical protein
LKEFISQVLEFKQPQIWQFIKNNYRTRIETSICKMPLLDLAILEFQVKKGTRQSYPNSLPDSVKLLILHPTVTIISGEVTINIISG